MTKLTMVEGIGEQYAQQLLDAGIETTEVLLERGATSQGRQELAETTGISDKLIPLLSAKLTLLWRLILTDRQPILTGA